MGCCTHFGAHPDRDGGRLGHDPAYSAGAENADVVPEPVVALLAGAAEAYAALVVTPL